MKAPAIIVILSALLLTSFVGCAPKNVKTVQERVAVTKVSLRDVISQSGEVNPTVKVELKSEASGRIDRIFVKEGQYVKKNDSLLRIDPTRLSTQKEKLDLSLERSQIQLRQANRDYNNACSLLALGGISQKNLDDLKTQADLADISVRQQQLDLRDINDQLSKTLIRAPMSGVLTSLLVKEGEIAISATSGQQVGTSIGTIADFSKLEVITQIGEVDYVKIKPNMHAIIRPEAAEGTQTDGTIYFVALSAKKKSGEELGTFEVRLMIDSIIPGIAPGINVSVDFVVLERNDVIGVPAQFVVKRGPRATVFVPSTKKDSKHPYERKQVEVGATDFVNYEIISGLTLGDTVITPPTDLPEGTRRPGDQRRGGAPAGGVMGGGGGRGH